MGAVERWFGEGFSALHPQLQQLHRNGGILRGVVMVKIGKGLGGWLGARIARGFGIDPGVSRLSLQVDIRSDNDVLHWKRKFGDGPFVYSEFRPVGDWPSGHWVEKTGAIQLALKVDNASGGWRWQPFRAWFHGVRVPLVLIPRVDAHKSIQDGLYEFYVGFYLPVFGLLISYGGRLGEERRRENRDRSD